MSSMAAKPRLACVASDSVQARAAQAELAARYDLVDPDKCDVIVALGGDGLLLHTIHDHLQLGRPIFGMNRGTVGFLMNQYRPDGLVERVAAASPITVQPLAMAARYADGSLSHALAFNEVAVTRYSGHSANIRLWIDGVERMAKFVGDGLIVATAAGSTAYNLSAHGPIIPLGANLLAVTPVSPFRPRRWRGALVPHTAEIVLDNLDADKRPLTATADFRELSNVVAVAIREDSSTTVQLLFDADHSLEERIIAEQFLSWTTTAGADGGQRGLDLDRPTQGGASTTWPDCDMLAVMPMPWNCAF
jgi:NAD+ kinase